MKNVTSMGLKYENQQLWILDQTLLPHQEKWVECQSPDQMVQLIQCLAVRGAPLIGVAAAMSLGQFAFKGANLSQVLTAAEKLKNARPTAVNLRVAIDRMILHQSQADSTSQWFMDEAQRIFDEDVALCEAMAERGADLIHAGDSILTHCNTGGLVTAGKGTALGVIRRAHEQGKKIHVYVDETRPLLQGARLTTWELGKLGIPHTLICDNMAGSLMSKGKVQKVFVGADRIARNGDFANKIGTYSVAVLAHFHKIPFYVVAPYTTFDPACPSGREIPIEERNADEVRAGRSPPNCNVWNPAFDVVPRALISGIVLNDRMI